LNGLYAAGNSDRRITERVASHPDSIGAKKPSELMKCSREFSLADDVREVNLALDIALEN
jgi:hypothetical protein